MSTTIYLFLNLMILSTLTKVESANFEEPNLYENLISIAIDNYHIIETRSVLKVERGYNIVILNRRDSTVSTTYKYDKIDNRFKFDEVVNGKFIAQDNAINIHIMQAMESLGVVSFFCPFIGENFKQWFNLTSGENIFLLNSIEQLQTPFYQSRELIYQKDLWVVFK